MIRVSELRYLSWCVLGALVSLSGCGSAGEDDLVGSAGHDDTSDDDSVPGTGGGSDDDDDSDDSGVPGLRAAPRSDDGDALFDPTVVRRIDLTIPTDNGSPSSWDSINAEAPVAGDNCVPIQRNYYEGSVIFEGATYDGVGIRTKGGCGSAKDQTLDRKPSFKINLSWDPNESDDQCPQDRDIYGQKHLTLNNAVQDYTGIHEHLAYQFYRAVGEPAPRTAAIQVYINGEYYGVYNLIESIDRSFLKRWFNTKLGRGMMYEGSYYCDFLTGQDIQPTDGHCWGREFELDSCDGTPDPEDDLQYFEADGVTPQDPWQFLRGIISTLEGIQAPTSYYPAIGQLFDWQAFLAHWASSTVVVDWDNYAQWQNNYRVYHEPAVNLWYVVPWGTDQTWSEPQATGGGMGGGGTWNWGGGLSSFGLFSPESDVARLCLDATGTDASGLTCTQSYVNEIYRELAIYEAIDWGAEIDAWSARLGPLLQGDDPHRDEYYSFSEWQSNVAELRSHALSRAQSLRTELANAGYIAP